MVQPIGPLMIEHRLIEQMISLIREKIGEIQAADTVDVEFIDAAVDFIQTYADRCHHGKEEQILFRDLEKKQMKTSDARIMQELIEEHVRGRKLTGLLVKAKERYASGDKDALPDILGLLKELTEFYPEHIKKEDKVFFKPSMGYFSKEEQDAMLDEMHVFDRQFIHEVYKGILRNLKTS